MKRKDNAGLGDLLKLGEAAFSALLGATENLKDCMEGKRDELVRRLDLVTREEFDAAFAMLKKARAVQESLEKRIAALEGKKGKSSPRKPLAKKRFRAKG